MIPSNNGAAGNKPRFSTILVARANNARPSDVEVHLRQHCQKMRVSSQPLNGAHLIFPQEHSLALRIYTALDVRKLDQQRGNTTTRKDGNDNEEEEEGFDDDGILAFTRKFQWTLVFFVLDAEHSGLLQTSPFVQGALRLTDTAMGSHHSSSEHKQQPQQQPPRILVVASTEQVLASLTAFADALRPHRCAGRESHVRQIRSQQRTPAALRAGIATAVRGWADRCGNLPAGEADVLLRCFRGSAVGVAAADARVLAGIPVEDRTKRLLQQFFAAAAADDDKADDEEQEGRGADEDAALPQSALVSPPSPGGHEGGNNDVGGGTGDATMMEYENVEGVDASFYKGSNIDDDYNDNDDNFTLLATQNDFGPPPVLDAYPERFEAQDLQALPTYGEQESHPLTQQQQQFRGGGPYHHAQQQPLQQPNRNATAYQPQAQDYCDQYSQAQQPPQASRHCTPGAPPRAGPQRRAPGYPPRAQPPEPWGSRTARRQPQATQQRGWNNNYGTAGTPYNQQASRSRHPNNARTTMTQHQQRSYPPHNHAMPAMRRYM